MKDLLNNKWKALSALLLANVILKAWDLLIVDEGIYVANIFFFFIYAMCFVGVTGLALNRRILKRYIWKLLFGLSSLVFVYTCFVTILVFPSIITTLLERTALQFVYSVTWIILEVLVLFLAVYGINTYANKREYIWENIT